MSLASATPKALDVVDLRLGSHHEVGFAETQSALVTLGPEQPAPIRANKNQNTRSEGTKHMSEVSGILINILCNSLRISSIYLTPRE